MCDDIHNKVLYIMTTPKSDFKVILKRVDAQSVNHNYSNIQLMHSFEVDIRICQPKNSDVHQGEAEVD